ncbi:MAG TPA: hypothetical protein VNV37_05120, partial [Solirubrobacteraceae bacterium]|nr:hypothetical protein [Solirubrobacteraceae bacterium]
MRKEVKKMRNPMNITSDGYSFTRRAVAVLAVVAGAVAGTLMVTAALASSGHAGHVRGGTGIAIFSHHHHSSQFARIASASTLTPPPGAILASVTGSNEVYVLHRNGGEDCVMVLHGSGGGACAPASTAEAEGAVGIFEQGEGATAPGSPATLQVATLVPNGVGSVVFTDRNGTSRAVTVTNNVAVEEGMGISSVSYTLPNGT